jgi:hypothetical protein
MHRRAAVLFCLTTTLAAGWILAQQPKQRASPHEKVTATIGGANVTIEYGRPYAKGRKIFGGLVPYGQVWRTGADEATKLTTSRDLMIGSLHVPAGTYSLFTVPNEGGNWTLVVNKTGDQWGAYKYEQGQDLGRVEMKTTSGGSPVEQLTIGLKSAGGNKGTLTIAWDTTTSTIDLMAH